MKKIVLILLSFLVVPTASAEGPNAWTSSAGGWPYLMESTTIKVDILNVGERIVWTGQASALCSSPSGNILQGNESPAGWFWETTATGVHEIFMLTSQESWDVRVTDANFQDLGAGRVFSKSWHLQNIEGSINAKLYIKTPTAVVEARLQGLVAQELFVFATPDAVTQGYSSVTFDSLQVEGAFEAMTGITPLNNLPIYVNKIPRVSNEIDPQIVVSFDQCPDPANVPEQAIVINSSSEGTHYTSCLSENGDQYRWTKGRVVQGDNWVPWSAIDNTMEPLGEGVFACTTLVVREEIHLPLAGVGTAYQGIRFFRVEGNARIPMYMHWDDSWISDVGTGPQGEMLPGASTVLGVGSGDPRADPSPYLADGTGNSRAWGDFTPRSGGYTAVMNTWGYVYSSPKTDHRVTIVGAAELAAACADTSPEDMGHQDMGSDDMGTDDMGSEDMGWDDMGPDPEVPDGEEPIPPSFDGTASGGACTTMGWGNSSLVILALFAFVGTLRRRF